MGPVVESGDLVGIGLLAGRVVPLDKSRPDGKPLLGLGGPDVLEHGFVAGERLSSPVLGDLAEEPVLDGIPLGGAGGVVGDGDAEAEGIAELLLEGALPGSNSVSVAAAAVCENEDAVGMGG